MSSFSPNCLYSYICLHFLLLYPFQYERMNLNALYFLDWSKCWPIWLCHQTRPPPSIEIRLSPTQLTVDRPHSLLSNQQQKHWTTINKQQQKQSTTLDHTKTINSNLQQQQKSASLLADHRQSKQPSLTLFADSQS